MKISLVRLAATIALLAAAAPRTLSQGTLFMNLDFEEGAFIPVPGQFNTVEFARAMPGWTGYLGSNQVDWILHNSLFLSQAGMAIWGPDNPSAEYLHGHYYVVLQNSFPVATDVPALAQTGTIPLGTESLRLYNNNQFGTGFLVFFAGQQIPLVSLGSAGNGRWVWGGDVSSYAGQTGELRFRGAGYLDHIQFSTEAVPEPRVLSLFALGALFLGWQALCKRNKAG